VRSTVREGAAARLFAYVLSDLLTVAATREPIRKKARSRSGSARRSIREHTKDLPCPRSHTVTRQATTHPTHTAPRLGLALGSSCKAPRAYPQAHRTARDGHGFGYETADRSSTDQACDQCDAIRITVSRRSSRRRLFVYCTVLLQNTQAGLYERVVYLRVTATRRPNVRTALHSTDTWIVI
jgi:hypothetical protein